MFDKLKNRLNPNRDETTEMMRRISKRIGGGAITLIDTDIAVTLVTAPQSHEELARTLAEFRETERLLDNER